MRSTQNNKRAKHCPHSRSESPQGGHSDKYSKEQVVNESKTSHLFLHLLTHSFTHSLRGNTTWTTKTHSPGFCSQSSCTPSLAGRSSKAVPCSGFPSQDCMVQCTREACGGVSLRVTRGRRATEGNPGMRRCWETMVFLLGWVLKGG